MLIHNDTKTQLEQRRTYEELYTILKKYCLSLTHNRWDADDVTQETIARTLSFYTPNREQNVPIRLMYTIARNYWIDEMRKKSKLQLGVQDECGYEDKPSEDLLEALEQLMGRLTPKQLLAFVMKESFMYSLTEIANKLQIQETAVKALLYRARQKSQDYSGDLSPHWINIHQDWFKDRLVHAVRDENTSILEELIIVVSATTIQKHAYKKSSTSRSMMLHRSSLSQMAA